MKQFQLQSSHAMSQCLNLSFTLVKRHRTAKIAMHRRNSIPPSVSLLILVVMSVEEGIRTKNTGQIWWEKVRGEDQKATINEGACVIQDLEMRRERLLWHLYMGVAGAITTSCVGNFNMFIFNETQTIKHISHLG